MATALVRFVSKAVSQRELPVDPNEEDLAEVTISRTIELSSKDYRKFVDNFLDEYDWLKNTGGETLEVLDVTTHQCIIVQTEGYNYARYTSYSY